MIDNWIPLPRYTLRKHLVLQFLKKKHPESKSCLEIGYGSGDMMISLAKLGMNAVGYDFSSKAFKIAKNRIKKRPDINKRLRLLTDERQINLSKYDFVIALEVLEHVKDDLFLLKRINNFLKQEGYIIFSVPAHMSKWGENDIWAGHYRRYEKTEIMDKLKSCNFEVRHIWSYGYPLILLLDLMIHKNRKKEVADLKGISKETLTQKSGVARERNFINLLASWRIWMLPFFLIQRVFLNHDISSAFLIIGQKKTI